jgi:hypothetical protein
MPRPAGHFCFCEASRARPGEQSRNKNERREAPAWIDCVTPHQEITGAKRR